MHLRERDCFTPKLGGGDVLLVEFPLSHGFGPNTGLHRAGVEQHDQSGVDGILWPTIFCRAKLLTNFGSLLAAADAVEDRLADCVILWIAFMTHGNQGIAVALFGELFMADQLARNRISRVLPKGMELSHFGVLNHLARVNDERTPAQLARAFHVTRGAMTNTLTKLEWAGHVHIRPDWDDARQKFVAISPAGRAARDAAVAAVIPMIADVVQSLGPDKVRAVLPILREMRVKLEGES